MFLDKWKPVVEQYIYMDKKSNILLFGGSIGLIIAAIVVTSLIDFSRSNKKTTVPVRASKTVSSMQFTGVVASFDQQTQTLIVDDLRFADSDEKSLGTWNITPPASFNSAVYGQGAKIRITANPVTFQIATKTLSAYEIEK
jgi:anti-sigma-K factor RskA